MIHSFIFSEGRLVGRDLELDALRLVRADRGLQLWVDFDQPTDAETRQIFEGVFPFHPLAIEDCVTPSSLPKVEDYDDYLFMVMHAVDFSRADREANEGIRVLTALTALTLPVLVIGGWYGMNFSQMSELHRSFTYPVAVALTAVSTLWMLIYLRRRRWF